MSFTGYKTPEEEKADFDKGQRALTHFRKLLSARYGPLLRAVTGNEKLKVEPHASGAFTDNKTVWLPVPLALGDETLEHDRDLCGRRDPSNMKMLCGMCKVEDETDGLVFHESAHITEQSFAKMRKSEIVKICDRAFGAEIMKLDSDKQQALTKRLRATSGDMMEVAGVLDTWLPFAVNVVEDIYVNRRLFANRLGTELPLQILTRGVFEEGIEEASTGTLHAWKDNDTSAQAIMSLYLIGQGLPELGVHLDPACDLTSDPELVKLAGEIPADCKPEDRLALGGRLVTYLRTLGFCPPKKDDDVLPQPPPPSPPEGDPQPPQGGEGDPEPGQGAQGEPGDEEGDDSTEGDGSGDTEESGDDDEASGSDSGDAEADGDDEGDSGDAEADGDDDEDGDDSAQGGDEADDDGEAGDDDSGKATPSKGVDGDDKDGKADEAEPDKDSQDDGDEEAEMRNLEAQTEAEIEEQARRAKELLTYVMGHGDSGPSQNANNASDQQVLERVLVQEDFDSPSHGIRGGYEFVTAKEAVEAASRKPHRVEIPRNLLTPSLARLRVVFASNRKTGIERNLRSGSRLDTMHLYRAGQDDNRIFGRKNVPKSRDWFVCVGLDFSGSTSMNGADHATKKAAHAVGELLHELGIRFAMYSHSSGYGDKGETLRHVEIKSPEANWKDSVTQDALFASRGGGVNLDGHSLEQYRKVVQAQRATDKLMLYFTDGEMPAANFNEELDLLEENIKLFKKDRCALLGIGYRTDSPKRHGLETIQYDHEDDIKSIVDGLEDHLR